MARAMKPIPTGKLNITKIDKGSNNFDYLATFTINGRRYREKNLTTLYGDTSISQAVKRLEKLKSMIRDGEDPFPKEKSEESLNFRDLVREEIETRKLVDSTRLTLLSTYDKHLYTMKIMQNKKPEEVDISFIEKILKQVVKNGISNDVLIVLKKCLNPTLDSLVDKNKITNNPIYSKTIKKIEGTVTEKAPLSHRLNSPLNKNIYKETAQSMYQSIMNYKKERGSIPENEIKLALLFSMMTARRKTEILKVQYEDIKDGIVRTIPENTKTKVYEYYPLSKEIIELLDQKGKGLVFPNLKKDPFLKYMKKIIKDAGLDTSAIYGHDTRTLFLTIMSKETKNPFLCDVCLSHKNKEHAMLLKYYTPDLEDFIEVFDAYWEILRETPEQKNL